MAIVSRSWLGKYVERDCVADNATKFGLNEPTHPRKFLVGYVATVCWQALREVEPANCLQEYYVGVLEDRLPSRDSLSVMTEYDLPLLLSFLLFQQALPG